ncbi:MAG: hypothetical protein F4X00_05770, partial [Gemmatimonadetes bacterium]|nr:hypothetical protein [Gemmatimonadota bacterium]MYD13117.1 hypothetical protein [Gemmatimonadota bacterium]MYE70517.1 hypothetical protein [Gemmatimonadota bacterium]
VWEPVESWVVAEAVRGEGGIARVADLPREDPPAPDVLDPGTDLAGPMAAVAEAAIRTREPTYRLDSVTGRAKTDAAAGEDSTTGAVPSLHTEAFAPPGLRPATGGFEWGSVVHEVLAAAGEGTTGDALIKLARDLLVEYERPVDSAGAPTELEALIAMVESVRGSEIWNRAMAAGERHAEIPFAVNAGPGPGRGDVIEGVIDLVFREAEKWVVADYKTDTGDDPDFMERVVRYRAQVDVYAQCWERLTGEEVAERVILFTSQGRTESW